MDNNSNTNNNTLQELPTKEHERLSNKYGCIDTSHEGTRIPTTLMGEKKVGIEQYRTKHFTCYTVEAV